MAAVVSLSVTLVCLMSSFQSFRPKILAELLQRQLKYTRDRVTAIIQVPFCQLASQLHTHTHPFNGPFPGPPR